MAERVLLKRSRTQEEAEEDIDSPATKRRDVQPGPSSDPPVNPGVVGFPSSSSWSSGEGSVNNKFDVFISHRGPDTKSTLAYHLYDLLRDRGVEAFLDKEELPSGERFPEAIEKAIACSKVDLCILSSGFAQSVWCLKELVMMLHKYERGLSTLIPIFYDVEPADVRHLKGDFGKGFVNLQSKGRNSSEDIEQWRLALRRIADIKGYEGKGEFSITIVKRICELLDVGCVDTPMNVITRENELRSTIYHIMRCHNNGLGVTSVEISGIGGIGKTTFAKELYNQIYTKYDRYCFIQDVNGLVEKHGVSEVHRQIFSKLFRDHQRYLTEGEELLKKRLDNAEILVVIDNIHSKIPLSTVFIEDNVSLNPRSTIIVTSREEGVLKYDSGVKGYCQNLISLEMKKLDFDTSKKIFCSHAFGGISNVKNEFNEMIEKIVTKCDGVPLALTVLGKHVYKQDIMFWRKLWSSIKDCLHGDVKKILKFSYDNLGSDLQKCLFLDVATFFRCEKEDLLLDIRQQSDEEDGKLQCQYALHMLKRNLLIYVSHDGILGMHDLLVDLGRSIVKDEDLCPGRRSRVWSRFDVNLMLSDEKGTKKVKALTLVSGGSPVLDEGHPWSTDVFSELSSLEILILHGDCIQGDFSKLSKKLLWLRWTDFPYQEIPLKLCIRHLRVLHVTGENLIQLWAHPPEEAPSKLRPSKLRQLIIPQCIKLQMLPEAIGRLRHLSLINLDKCISLKHIPDSFGQLRGLKHLRLWRCDALECLPETLGGLTSLRTLHISRCGAVVSLPESVGELEQLCCIHLDECRSLKITPYSVGQLKALKYFHLHNCKTSKQLPGSFGDLFMKQLTSLDHLHVSDTGFSWDWGPDQLRPPRQLREEVPGNLYLWYWSTNLNDDMEVADSWFARMGTAVHPNFDFWKNYSQVPKPHNLRWLLREAAQHIQMKKHRYLDSINNNNDTGASQARLELIDIRFIESASNNITLSDEVTSLKLEGLWNLRELPQSVGNLRCMTSLYLSNCYSLQKLPESPRNLRKLSLRWCCNLQSIGNLPHLSSLEVVGCLALKRFPSLGNLSYLEELRVEHCWMVEVIHIQGLFRLKCLFVHDCVNLKSIVGLSDLRELQVLEIERCMNLKSIVGLSDLRKLKCLRIRWCFGLTHMPLPVGGFASFNSLDYLIIDGCYQLRFSEAQLPVTSEYRLWLEDARLDAEAEALLRAERVRAKTSPLFFATVKERLTHVLRSSPEKPSFFVHEIAESVHVPSLPFVAHALVACFVSSVYANDFPAHIPLPVTHFRISESGTDFPIPSIGYSVSSDFGEEINVEVHDIRHIERRGIERGDFGLNVDVRKDMNVYGYDFGPLYPSYEAGVKEAFIIFLDGGGREQSKTLASKIRNIFVSELEKQRLMSRAWTELPSQLRIHDFSALDIAGCQITKISRHCNTYIMEEETGLTWKIRRSIFMDDHSLLLQQPKNSKHSFLAYPGVDRDLEAAVANLYEMSISILAKGKEVHSRKLQQIRPKTEEEIPSPLITLLQSRGFHFTSKTMHWLSLLMLEMLKKKSIHVSFVSEIL